MAAGATTISGAFRLSDTADIEGFIEDIITVNSISGASVFTYQDQENKGVWVGVVEGGGTGP